MTAKDEQGYIGETMTFEGTAEGTGNLVWAGQLRGCVNFKGTLRVAPTGRIEATVSTDALEVAGEVKGRISIRGKATVQRQGRIFGELRAKSLFIEEGATAEAPFRTWHSEEDSA